MPVSSGYFAKSGVDFRFIADSQAVLAAMDRKERRVLGRTGGNGRRIMQNFLRSVNRGADRKFKQALIDFRNRKLTKKQLESARKATASTPPDPPRQHVGTLRRMVFYAVDRDGSSVVIGPLQFQSDSKPEGGKTGAQLLEEGGRLTIKRKQFRKTVTVAPRPWLEDARKKTEPVMLKILAEENL